MTYCYGYLSEFIFLYLGLTLLLHFVTSGMTVFACGKLCRCGRRASAPADRDGGGPAGLLALLNFVKAKKKVYLSGVDSRFWYWPIYVGIPLLAIAFLYFLVEYTRGY